MISVSGAYALGPRREVCSKNDERGINIRAKRGCGFYGFFTTQTLSRMSESALREVYFLKKGRSASASPVCQTHQQEARQAALLTFRIHRLIRERRVTKAV